MKLFSSNLSDLGIVNYKKNYNCFVNCSIMQIYFKLNYYLEIHRYKFYYNISQIKCIVILFMTCDSRRKMA